MKKLLAMLIVAALAMTCFAFAETASDPYMTNARSYLRTMYKSSPETTMTDYDVVGGVRIADVIYPIVWTADSETVKIIDSSCAFSGFSQTPGSAIVRSSSSILF